MLAGLFSSLIFFLALTLTDLQVLPTVFVTKQKSHLGSAGGWRLEVGRWGMLAVVSEMVPRFFCVFCQLGDGT